MRKQSSNRYHFARIAATFPLKPARFESSIQSQNGGVNKEQTRQFLKAIKYRLVRQEETRGSSQAKVVSNKWTKTKTEPRGPNKSLGSRVCRDAMTDLLPLSCSRWLGRKVVHDARDPAHSLDFAHHFLDYLDKEGVESMDHEKIAGPSFLFLVNLELSLKKFCSFKLLPVSATVKGKLLIMACEYSNMNRAVTHWTIQSNVRISSIHNLGYIAR